MRKLLYGILGCLILISLFLGIQRLTATHVEPWNPNISPSAFSGQVYSITFMMSDTFASKLHRPFG